MTPPPLRVLCAFDGSPSSRAALRAAAELLQPAEMTVLTVRDGPALSDAAVLERTPIPDEDVARSLADRDEELLGEARKIAEDGAAIVGEAGVSAEARVLRAARPWRAIEAVAATHDLIVCGTRGHGAVSRAVLGSTSSSLLRHARRPILVVPAEAAVSDGPIVAAYDDTPTPGDAVRFAGVALRSRRLIAASAATPWRRLLSLAEREHAAIVVCGASGSGAFGSGSSGSVAAGLVHHATLPVLVVPVIASAARRDEVDDAAAESEVADRQ